MAVTVGLPSHEPARYGLVVVVGGKDVSRLAAQSHRQRVCRRPAGDRPAGLKLDDVVAAEAGGASDFAL